MGFGKLQTTGGASETFEKFKIKRKFEIENEIIKMIILLFKYYLINKTN